MLLEAGLKQKYCFGNRPLNIVQFMDDNLGLVTEKIRFLNNLFKAYRCVSFLIVRTPLGSNRISVYGEEEALCDGIMILGSRKVGADAEKKY